MISPVLKSETSLERFYSISTLSVTAVVWSLVGMNQTGLAESLQPTLSSTLLSNDIDDIPPIRTNYLTFPCSPEFSRNYRIPFVADISPLSAKPEGVKPGGNCLIPRCQKCNALPSAFTQATSSKWTCAVCKAVNPVYPTIFCPKKENYDVQLSQGPRPLYLFVFQCDVFFASDAVKSSVGRVLEEWSKGIDADVALVGIGAHAISFDLKRPRANVMIDCDDFRVNVCKTGDAKFASGMEGLKPSVENAIEDRFFLKTLLQILKGIERKNICLCLFASQFIGENETIDAIKKLIKEMSISVQLFTRKHLTCKRMVKCFDKIRIIPDDSPHLIAPMLSKFLKSGQIFEAEVMFHYNTSLMELNTTYSSRKTARSQAVSLAMIDGQTSVTYELLIKKLTMDYGVYFQASVKGILPDGRKILRVLNLKMKTTGNVEKFNGVVFGCLLAKRRASDALFDGLEESYRQHREECINYISNWSADGQYRRRIVALLRDVPLLMFAIEVSDLFSSDATEVQKMAAIMNILSLPVRELKRMLYPALILPPLSFLHRLKRSSIGNFKTCIFIRAFDGLAFKQSDDVDDAELATFTEDYDVPITVYDMSLMPTKCLVEELGVTFPVFAEKLEVEVNGRRF